MPYYRAQVIPSKLTYRTVAQDVQICDTTNYIPITFGTIQGLKYVTVKIEKDIGGGTVYEGSVTISVSNISGTSAKVAEVYLNNDFSDSTLEVDLSMSYTEASVAYSGSKYDMYITILGFPMDIFAPVSLVRTPYIMGDSRNKMIKLPLVGNDVDKFEMDAYFPGLNSNGRILIGTGWSTNGFMLKYDNVSLYMSGNRNNVSQPITFANTPIYGGHKIVMQPDNSTFDGVIVSSHIDLFSDSNQLALFGRPYDGNYTFNGGIGRTKLYKSDVLLMDLVPVNKRVSVFDLIKDQDFVGNYDTMTYNDGVVLGTSTFTRTHLCFSSRCLDSNGDWHYADDIYVAITDVTSTQYGLTVNPVFDNGIVGDFLISNSSLGNNMETLPTGITKFVVTLSNVHSTKEGCFFDTIGQKYYFSNTAVPLEYSEL